MPDSTRALVFLLGPLSNRAKRHFGYLIFIKFLANITFMEKERTNGYNFTCKVVGSPAMDVIWTRNSAEIATETHMQTMTDRNGTPIYETQISTLISDLQVGVKLEICCVAKDTLASTTIDQQCTTIGCGK